MFVNNDWELFVAKVRIDVDQQEMNEKEDLYGYFVDCEVDNWWLHSCVPLIEIMFSLNKEMARVTKQIELWLVMVKGKLFS